MKDVPLGEAVDQLYAATNHRKEVVRHQEEELANLQRNENEIEQYILLLLQKEKLSGTRGSKAQVSVRPAVKPMVQDWLAVYKFIVENDAFDLLQKRIASTAWKDRVEHGTIVPGVEALAYSTLHVTKIS